MAVTQLLLFVEDEGPGSACMIRGGRVAGDYYDAVEIAGGAEGFEHLFVHQAGQALPAVGREKLPQALFRVDRRFYGEQSKDQSLVYPRRWWH